MEPRCGVRDAPRLRKEHVRDRIEKEAEREGQEKVRMRSQREREFVRDRIEKKADEE